MFVEADKMRFISTYSGFVGRAPFVDDVADAE